MDYRYLVKRGKAKDFSEGRLVPGEFEEVLDKHTLAFCFEEGNVHYLNVDETVSEEKADELISLIKWFIENSFAVYTRRFEERWRNGKTV